MSVKSLLKRMQPLGSLKIIGLFVLLVIITALSVFNWQQHDQLRAYDQLLRSPNEACFGLNYGAATNKFLNFIAYTDTNAMHDVPPVTFRCIVDQTVPAATIQGKHVASYNLGAYAYYFTDHQAALDYAARVLNPMRYWGVDEAGQQAGIPQTSLFTFIVTDQRPTAYYDAYTVRGKAVIRLSLPCGDQDVINGGVSCYAEAQASLQSFASHIGQLEL